jgi:hypothetical protein
MDDDEDWPSVVAAASWLPAAAGANTERSARARAVVTIRSKLAPRTTCRAVGGFACCVWEAEEPVVLIHLFLSSYYMYFGLCLLEVIT